jgi:hypothetical protein
VQQADELERFFATWDYETQGTLKLLRALPKDKYDFRPDANRLACTVRTVKRWRR